MTQVQLQDFGLGLAVLAATVGIGTTPAVAQDLGDLSAIVSWSDTLILEENRDVVNVLYNVEIDPAGGFLVADTREGQFRRYASDGRLLWAFGRKGDGPAEFFTPLRASRLGNGSLVALLDRRGKVAVLDEAGDSLVSTARTDLIRISDSAVLNGGDVWIGTSLLNPNDPKMFYRLDITSGEQLATLPPPWPGDQFGKEEMYMNWSGLAPSSTTGEMWVTIAASDTIYRVGLATGQYTQRIPIQSRLFKPMTKGSAEEWESVQGRRGWAENQSYLTDLYPLADGRFVVQPDVSKCAAGLGVDAR